RRPADRGRLRRGRDRVDREPDPATAARPLRADRQRHGAGALRMAHAADNDRPLVSTVIAVRNDADGLAHTLAALSAQTLPHDRFEVIVVDDASTDATAAVARSHAG